jgi:hypothetical protein
MVGDGCDGDIAVNDDSGDTPGGGDREKFEYDGDVVDDGDVIDDGDKNYNTTCIHR